MKKVLSSMLATAMVLGISATAFASPIYEEGEILKNTVTGFAGGATTATANVSHTGGNVNVEFGLGDNANYYDLDIDVKDGGRHLDAEYSKSKKAIVLRPTVSPKLTEAEEYEIEIEVLDRKTKDTVAKGFTLSGEITYSEVQSVESDRRYNNSRGSLYDFDDGVSNVEIRVNDDITVSVKKAAGLQNFDISDASNESIDFMFSKHELEYINFVGHPKTSGAVKVSIDADTDLHLYEYVGGSLKKIQNAVSDEHSGFVFETNQLGTYILADMPLTEGVVNEGANTVRPGGSTGSSSSNSGTGSSNSPSTDKNNPSTGAPELAA